MDRIIEGLQVFATETASILVDLDSRNASLWVLPSFVESAGAEASAKVVGLPWECVLDETADTGLIEQIEALSKELDSPLVRNRGLIYVIDGAPSSVRLPPRSLPIFLLNPLRAIDPSSFGARMRRMEAIAELPRREVLNLVVLGGPNLVLPAELMELWADGFRCNLTIASDDPEAPTKIEAWQAATGAPTVRLISATSAQFAEELYVRYTAQSDDRLVVRVRDAQGARHEIDLTGRDDPENPLLATYELLTESMLSYIPPDGLDGEEVNGFFQDPSASWRPYAAGMPWPREELARSKVARALRELDRKGPEANRIFYVRAEAGAGATTFVRTLAFGVARDGYPALVATHAPFVPNGRKVEKFITSCLSTIEAADIGDGLRHYEVPWLIVFDRSHWEGHERDIAAFATQIASAGRRACIILVADAVLPIPVLSEKRLEELCILSHEVAYDEAMELGRHLNTFLKPLGTARVDSEWKGFLERSLVAPEFGRTAFWIALAFWLRRQINMDETVQDWLYGRFKQGVTDPVSQRAIIDIAAMSSVRELLPETLLPQSEDFPTRDKLTDLQSTTGALGISRQRFDTVSYWAMIHAELGRYLLIELFHDAPARETAGLSVAVDPDHLRLMVLKRVASDPRIAHPDFRNLAEAFATSVFKIDPGQGYTEFATFWREALDALDAMPETFRTTSRTFLHHSAISRRRIAKDEGIFPIALDERAALLDRSARDIEAALALEIDPRDEPDLNLYNSLAHAYHDLAEVEAARGEPNDTVTALRAKANAATRQAYALNPDNSYVLELYARDRLQGAEDDPESTMSVALEVLGIVYGAMARETARTRRNALASLADRALDLMMQSARDLPDGEPQSEGEAIAQALSALVRETAHSSGMTLTDFPKANRIEAHERLGHLLLRTNAQAIRLRYVLSQIDCQRDFSLQLELLQALEGSRTILSPQLQLELAILEHQGNRHHDASRRFRELRRLWAEGTHFVEVPKHLGWLIDPTTGKRRQVRARIASGTDGIRSRAKIEEFRGEQILFRPNEFASTDLRPGTMISGLVSFGHNGPFLRPLTAG